MKDKYIRYIKLPVVLQDNGNRFALSDMELVTVKAFPICKQTKEYYLEK